MTRTGLQIENRKLEIEEKNPALPVFRRHQRDIPRIGS
jgi:hypothetical protein